MNNNTTKILDVISIIFLIVLFLWLWLFMGLQGFPVNEVLPLAAEFGFSIGIILLAIISGTIIYLLNSRNKRTVIFSSILWLFLLITYIFGLRTPLGFDVSVFIAKIIAFIFPCIYIYLTYRGIDIIFKVIAWIYAILSCVFILSLVFKGGISLPSGLVGIIPGILVTLFIAVPIYIIIRLLFNLTGDRHSSNIISTDD